MKAQYGNLTIDFGRSVENFGKKLTQRAQSWERDGMKRMQSAVNIVYNTAHAKRPMTNFVKVMGEDVEYPGSRVPKEISQNFRTRRVSNPNAKFGVPVRTGNLRDSIKKEVRPYFHRIVGTVWVDEVKAPYAKYLEYGTSKMAARPFMRPAKDLNRKIIHDIIGVGFKE